MRGREVIEEVQKLGLKEKGPWNPNPKDDRSNGMAFLLVVVRTK
jgi:hypothetical protein